MLVDVVQEIPHLIVAIVALLGILSIAVVVRSK